MFHKLNVVIKLSQSAQLSRGIEHYSAVSTMRLDKESSSQHNHKGSHSLIESTAGATTRSLPPDSERGDNMEDIQLIFELTNHLK